jgi:hypothetical protein
VNNFGTDRDILKIQTDLNSANQRLSLEIKFIFMESKALLKISETQNPNISVASQNFKKWKKGVPKSSNGTFPQSLVQIGWKKWRSSLMG